MCGVCAAVTCTVCMLYTPLLHVWVGAQLLLLFINMPRKKNTKKGKYKLGLGKVRER